MNFDNISPEIKVYLDEISERLFTHHAAVMVGAGFSKNAIPNSASCKKMSDWNDLGNVFYEKLYGKDAEFPKKDFLNVLKLAEEVEAAFGRPVLDNILRKCIPDMEYEPSNLHKKLLDLPWIDIFTTNYDTLLERAAKSVFNRKYTVVFSKEDLVYASKPRIIKLHGSFLSFRPFTITEEDYRVYPKINAPFVNTVQQSLLENTLCLIGFSGEDPNFFQWLGWLRDNLGTNIPKIYLIGSFKLSDTQKRLLEKRNIILVNLASDHNEALNLFIEYLAEKVRANNILFWPYNEVYKFPLSKDYLEETLTKIISIWKNERISYPGWVILPEEKRSAFYEATEEWVDFLSDSDDVQYDIKFNFIFELCWRLDKALCPLNIEIANLIKSVLRENIDSNEEFSLALWLLKFYRQNGLNNEWENLCLRMEGFKHITANQKGELDYENGLQALFNLDYQKLKTITEKWLFPKETPFANAKKAGILFEMGELSKAKEKVEESLVKIRERQTDNTSAADCSFISQESYVLYLYQYILWSSDYKNWNVKNREFKDRIAILSLYLCNPVREQEHFTDLLSSTYKKEVDEEIEDTYDIGISKIINYPEKYYTEQKHAYSFLLYCENIGVPFCINNKKWNSVSKEARAAIIRIADFNLFWAISVCCRTADKTAAEAIFTRNLINNFPIEINDFCGTLVSLLAENEKEIASENTDDIINFAQILAKILPEIISRFCAKCNFDIKSKVLQLINSILSAKSCGNYQGVGFLIKRFMESLLPSEIEQFLIGILKLKIPEKFDKEIKPPLQYLTRHDFVFSKNFSLEETILEPYYVASASDVAHIRWWGLATLIKLNEFALLNIDQQKRLAEVLWIKTDNIGLPIDTDCLRTDFITLPYPPEKKPLDVVKKSLKVFKLYNFIINKGDLIQNILYVENFFKDISALIARNFFDESEKKAIIDDIFAFWKNNNEILKIQGEAQLSFRETTNQIIIFFHRMQLTLASLLQSLRCSYCIEKIKNMVCELESYGISTIHLQYILNSSSLKDTLILQIGANNNLKRIDALIVLEKFFFTEVNDENCYLFKALLFSILYGEDKFIYYNIDAVIGILKNKVEFAEKLKAEMLNVLLHLENITKYDYADSKLSFEEKLAIRQGAMRLAFILHKNWANADNEKEIKYWKDCSEDENEFAEVRNKWGK